MNEWYLLYCKKKEQERAIVNLNRQGVETYYPTMAVEKIRRGKRGIEHEAMFPNYVFVNFNAEKIAFTTVRSTRGVSKFVQFTDSPSVIPIELIERMKVEEQNLQEQGTLNETLTKGDKVEITDGAYKGVEAIFHESDGEKRCFILITMLSQHVKYNVSNREIKKKN